METAFATLKTDFLQNSSAQAAEKMSAYMLNQFPFIGLTAPFRRQLASTFIKSSITEPLEKIFTVVDALWDLPQREFQYIAIDLMQKNIKRLNLAHLPFLLDLALKNPGGIVSTVWHLSPIKYSGNHRNRIIFIW